MLKQYRARLVMPIDARAIVGGVIQVADGRIVDVQPFNGQADVIDLGDIALLPRLVNAHTHLEFSDLRVPIGDPGLSIAQWIPQVVAHRGANGNGLAQRSAAIVAGIEESCASGVGAIGEIATRPWPAETIRKRLLADATWPLEMTAFHEVLGLHPQRASSMLQWAQQAIQETRASHASQGEAKATDEYSPLVAGISPHAPYSCPETLLKQCLAVAEHHSVPVAMHLAESWEERRLVEQGDGPLHHAFTSLGLPGLERFPEPFSIAQIIKALAQAPRGLIVHGNYLNDDEIGVIAQHRDKLSLVYCPRTHAFFNHPPHPLGRLIDAGINIALGTDSRASNPDLNLWHEVQYLLNHRQDIEPSAILRWATIGGCRALGLSSPWTIQPGAPAQMIGVRCMTDKLTPFLESLATETCRPLRLG